MLQENYEIQPFEMKNIPLMLEVVVPMWSPPVEDMTFRRFYVEHIIRNNYFENEYHYQLMEREQDGTSLFTAMAFFARKSDICKADDWFKLEAKKIPLDLQRSMQKGKLYIELMDEKTRAFKARRAESDPLFLDEPCDRKCD